MVIAPAGRPIDAPAADIPGFPVTNVAAVRARVRVFLMERAAQAIICAAACGVDWLALESAEEFGLRQRVVLPYTRARFRETSVGDQPGEWGERFDAFIDAAEMSSDLIVLGCMEGDETTYFTTNTAIFVQASLLAEQLHDTVGAAVVWDGVARGEDDVTAAFMREAQHQGTPIWQISTL